MLDPDNVAAHQRLGRTYFQLSKPTEAYKEFEDAAKADSHSLNPYIALAELYEQAKDRTNAAKSIDFAVQKNPKDLNVQIMAARLALNTNQLNETQRYAEKALQIDPKSLDAKVLRAAIARMTGDLKTAETFLEQASTQAPANPEVRNQLALVLVEQDDKEKRIGRWILLNLTSCGSSQGDRVNPEIAATYAWVLYKQGKIDEAERILSQVLTRGPSVQTPLIMSARSCRIGGRPKTRFTFWKSVGQPQSVCPAPGHGRFIGAVTEAKTARR